LVFSKEAIALSSLSQLLEELIKASIFLVLRFIIYIGIHNLKYRKSIPYVSGRCFEVFAEIFPKLRIYASAGLDYTRIDYLYFHLG